MKLAEDNPVPFSDAEAKYEEDSPFPIQRVSGRVNGSYRRAGPTYIPRWLAEIAYDEYSRRYGTSQSLDRLGERGGFGRKEFLTLLKGYLDRHPEVT